MSLFKNQNFITQIAKQHGIYNELPPTIGALIQGSVENQTRRLIEHAFKVMTHSHRQELQVSDIETALTISNLRDISLTPAEEKYEKLESGYLRSDKMFTDCEQFIKEELKEINHIFEKPQIKGRWVLFNEIVPRLSENHHIKNFREIQQLQLNELKERNKKFNIIRDQPLGLVTVEQQDFFRSMTAQLEQGVVPDFLDGNPQKLMTMLVWYLKSCDISDTIILFLLELLRNSQVQQVIEQHLYTVLIILMSYEGVYSWRAGTEIARLILQWRHKYPNIMDIVFQEDEGCYSIKIKKLAFEQALNLDLQVNPLNNPSIDRNMLDRDIDNNVPMAKQFMYLVNKPYEIKAAHSEAMTIEDEGEIYNTYI